MNIKPYLITGLIILALASFALLAVPDWRFWNTPYERHLAQCKFSLPEMNTTDSYFCYTEGWSEYCKVSYPNHCPRQKDAENIEE